MRSLQQALQDHELIVLRVIGEWWELDLTGADKPASVKALAERLAQLDLQQEMMFLPREEVAALQDLVAQGGRVPVAAFSREHGEVRMMGPGRMEREEPWYDPVSPTEALWYRGIVYRGFDETADGMLEFYYLPEELLAQVGEPVQKVARETAVSMLQPVTSPTNVRTAVTDAVDDLTALMALALQTDLTRLEETAISRLLLVPDRDRRSLLLTLAGEMEMVRRAGRDIRPTRTAVDWLRRSRDAQLHNLAEAWSNSSWNDLRHTPGIICEGESWNNEPILARAALLDALPRSDGWFNLADLVAHIKESDPDFQRPDGNFDTWYIRDEVSGDYLAGFSAWDYVEGRLLRFLVQGPLYWLGMVETAVRASADDITFRLTPRALDWLTGEPPRRDEVQVPLVVQADGTILVPYNAERYQRFRAARIAEPQPVEPGQPFPYRLTPASLQGAQEQGVSAERLIKFLAEASGRSVPKSVQRGIERWSQRGVEGRLESVIVLRVREAAILDTLRNNSKTRDYISESLGDLAAVIRTEDWDNFRAATAELGLLLDVDIWE